MTADPNFEAKLTCGAGIFLRLSQILLSRKKGESMKKIFSLPISSLKFEFP